jgi:hypothetical protein
VTKLMDLYLVQDGDRLSGSLEVLKVWPTPIRVLHRYSVSGSVANDGARVMIGAIACLGKISEQKGLNGASASLLHLQCPGRPEYDLLGVDPNSKLYEELRTRQ